MRVEKFDIVVMGIAASWIGRTPTARPTESKKNNQWYMSAWPQHCPSIFMIDFFFTSKRQERPRWNTFADDVQ